MTSAKILAHSISPDGVALVTMEVVFPRIVLAEWNTHRVFSRNSASSRAIPVQRMIDSVMIKPYIPDVWPRDQKGMSARENLLSNEAISSSRSAWFDARDSAVRQAQNLLALGVHKQITNRLLEPFMWHTVIVTATEWSNFFNLRCHPAAHPEIRKVAELMRDALAASVSKKLDYEQWHLPLIGEQERVEIAGWADDWMMTMVNISVARCARVSYLTHDGRRDAQADLDLHDRLLESGHLSPFEHAARPMGEGDLFKGYVMAPSTGRGRTLSEMFSGNLRGWIQYRKLIPKRERHSEGARGMKKTGLDKLAALVGDASQPPESGSEEMDDERLAADAQKVLEFVSKIAGDSIFDMQVLIEFCAEELRNQIRESVGEDE